MNCSGPNSSSNRARILVVEDEEMLKMMVETILQNCGYEVRTAGSGEEALAVWRQHDGSFDLLLTDMALPDGVTGRQIAKQMQMERPSLKVIYASGFTTDTIEETDEKLDEDTNFLQKPYTTQALSERVQRTLQGERSLQQAA